MLDAADGLWELVVALEVMTSTNSNGQSADCQLPDWLG